MRYIVIVLLICAQFNLLAKDSTLVFRNIKYSQVFEIAKVEKKAVLLYFHFDGCAACTKMEKTVFIDTDVASFYNSNFICLEINTRKGEGIETNKIYNVKMHPTFLFLDTNGMELQKMVGVFSSGDFILQAKNAISQSSSLAFLKNKYAQGSRDASFLLDYCYALRNAGELDSVRINEYLSTQMADDLLKEENIKFIYEFMLHNGNICIATNTSAYKFMRDNKEAFSTYYSLEQVNTRLMFVVLNEVYNAIKMKDSVSFYDAIEKLKVYDIGKEYSFEEMDGRVTKWTINKALVLSAKIEYFEAIGDIENYDKSMDHYIETIWNDSEQLNTLAWDYYLKYEDMPKLELAIHCVKRSVELNSNYANNDTYACLLFKTGKTEKALEIAERAISLAKKEQVNYDETSRLVTKIKEQLKKGK